MLTITTTTTTSATPPRPRRVQWHVRVALQRLRMLLELAEARTQALLPEVLAEVPSPAVAAARLRLRGSRGVAPADVSSIRMDPALLAASVREAVGIDPPVVAEEPPQARGGASAGHAAAAATDARAAAGVTRSLALEAACAHLITDATVGALTCGRVSCSRMLRLLERRVAAVDDALGWGMAVLKQSDDTDPLMLMGFRVSSAMLTTIITVVGTAATLLITLLVQRAN